MKTFTPHSYQRYSIGRIITDHKIALWAEPGLGKTATALTAINDLKFNRFLMRKALVVAPKKVAEATWQKEARKWKHLQHLRFSAVMGSAAKRIRALNTPADVYVINRDNLKWLVDYYRNDWPFDTAILDESTTFKNHKAQRFKAMALVAPRTKRIIQLTGTPTPKGLLDLWAQIYLLDGGERLGKTFTVYRDTFFMPNQRSRTQIFNYAPRPGAEEEIYRRLADIAVSLREDDWLDLPDRIEKSVPVVLDSKAQAAYNRLERDMLLEVDGDTITATTAAVLRGKLLQLGNGAVYDGQGGIAEVHNCKIEALLELMESLQGKPVLIAYNFQHDRDRIIKALSRTGLQVRVYKGAEEEKDWNAGKIDVLLAHPASCAYGLNLQDGPGRHTIWFGLTDNLEHYQQFNKRLHRQGVSSAVFIIHLVVQGSVDEDVMTSTELKAGSQEALMDAMRARIERAHCM